MTINTQPTPPPDREEHVEVVNRPDEYAQRRVVRNPAADQRVAVSRVTQVIWLLFGFLEALIAIRIVLKLIGANPDAVFSQFVYGVTSVFLWPFSGLVGTPAVAQYQLEVFSIIAMIVYGLIGWALTRLIWVLFYRPTTDEVTSYREERF
ncbi:MAG TPA: hypothetical protein VF823_08500 [Anaerolineales bacterium]